VHGERAEECWQRKYWLAGAGSHSLAGTALSGQTLASGAGGAAAGGCSPDHDGTALPDQQLAYSAGGQTLASGAGGAAAGGCSPDHDGTALPDQQFANSAGGAAAGGCSPDHDDTALPDQQFAYSAGGQMRAPRAGGAAQRGSRQGFAYAGCVEEGTVWQRAEGRHSRVLCGRALCGGMALQGQCVEAGRREVWQGAVWGIEEDRRERGGSVKEQHERRGCEEGRRSCAVNKGGGRPRA